MEARTYKAVIIIRMPDGINYYCGKTIFEGKHLDTWNTQIEQAIIYLNKPVAKKRLSILKRAVGQSSCKLKDFNRLPKPVREQRNNFLNNKQSFKTKNNGNNN